MRIGRLLLAVALTVFPATATLVFTSAFGGMPYN